MGKNVANKNTFVTDYIRSRNLTELNSMLESVNTEFRDYADFRGISPETLYAQVAAKYKEFLAQSKSATLSVAAIGDKWRAVMLQIKNGMDTSETLKREGVWSAPMTHATMDELVKEKDKHLAKVFELMTLLKKYKAEGNYEEFMKLYPRFEKEEKLMRGLERVIALFHTTVDTYSKSANDVLEAGKDYEVSDVQRAYTALINSNIEG